MLTQERLRKAAVLIDSLDSDRAEALLEQMPPEQQQVIRNLVVELGDIDRQEREQVINEFLSPGASQRQNSVSDVAGQGGAAQNDATETQSKASPEASLEDALPSPVRVQPEYDLPATSNAGSMGNTVNAGIAGDDTTVGFDETQLLDDSISPRTAAKDSGQSQHQKPLPADQLASWESTGDEELESWLAQIRTSDPDQLSRLLSLERPQTIAIILSRLDADQAQVVARKLDAELRRIVLKRIVTLDETPDEIVKELVKSLWQRLGNREAPLTIQLASPGIKALERILLAAEDNERSDLLASLAQESPDLVNQLVSLHGWENDWGQTKQQGSSVAVEAETESGDLRQSTRADQPSSEGEAFSSQDSYEDRDESKAVILPLPFSSFRQQTNSDQQIGSEDLGDVPEQAEPEGIASHLLSGLDALEQSSQSTFSFDELARLKDRSLAELMRAADPKQVLLALLGAEPKLLKKTKRGLRRSEAKQLSARLAEFGAVRLSDVEHAQAELVNLAQSMMQAKEIEHLQ